MNNQEHSVGRVGRPKYMLHLARFLPIGVIAATLLVIAWSVWPVIRPTRSVEVTQAVFDRNSQPKSTEPEPGESARAGKVVQAAGWLEAEPFTTACTSLVDGVVEEMMVLEGDWVEKGEVVAQLVREDEELRVRIEEAAVIAAKGRLARAQSDLVAAEARWADPIELDRRLETRRAELEESRAELAQLPKLVAASRAELKRMEAERDWLARTESGGAATELELLVATQNAEAKRNEIEAIEARQPMIESRIARHTAELRAAERDIELRIEDHQLVSNAKAAVESAEADLALAEARRDEAALALSRTTITAPISGYVLRRIKAPGDKVIQMMDEPHSAHLVHIYDPSKLQVRVDVPLADASHVHLGQACEVVVEILPDRTFKGEVLRITHEADLQKNTLEIKVKVIDPDPLLKPEMLTRVRFLAGKAPAGQSAADDEDSKNNQSVLVASESIGTNAQGDCVWVIGDRSGTRGVLREIAVQRLAEEGAWVRVSGAIQPGALLAISEDGLKEGMPISIKRTNEEDAS